MAYWETSKLQIMQHCLMWFPRVFTNVLTIERELEKET